MPLLLLGAIATTRAPSFLFFSFTLGASMLFGYGFANVGLPGRVPIPAADVLLATCLLGLVLTGARFPRHSVRAPFVGAVLLMAWGTGRVVADYPVWGNLALRDYSIFLEVSALFVGYWLMERYGLNAWIRMLTIIFAAVLVYGLTYPIQSRLAELGPTVGLQKPVDFLGHYSGPAILCVFFFFVLLRPIGVLSIPAAALSLFPVLMTQSRGMYLALPVGIIVMLVVRTRDRSLSGRTVAVIVVSAVVAMALFTLAPQGRYSRVSPTLISNQLGTILGHQGTGSGSARLRREWLSDTLDRVRAHHLGLAIGIGLGPDLANGFSTDGETDVRKPHDDFLEMFARTGVLGLALLIGTIGSALLIVWRRLAVVPTRDQLFLSFVLVSSSVYLLIATTQPLLAYPYGTLPLFGLLGAALWLAGARDPR